MKYLKLSLLAASLIVPQGAFAHTDEYLDTQAAPHGGQLRMAGIYHYELVVIKDSHGVKENPVVVYVTDHAGAKIATAGATGTATILAGKLKATATLKPDGDNRMKGFAKYASTPDMKGVVSITLSARQPEQARFTPLAVAPDEHMDHKH
ncbi:MAG: hypothetical protein CO125_05900 [Hydrogenophilales bacterium CG_4_9_14_3_um_filter_59_35]|nr:MAG: hypothetical protein COW70_01995 [Hydrogenophilales bacterium CG18_big_fil_WC_8_21_14_2_50_58_12]PIY01053.1 MAG: hypothetical protein COZ23_05210 [Hydrogenophilales bacterium CG_4_10_14_3_um_filter_58_23]PJB07114.1 MAG: hypothetical protein CO125_05900 [Hydrogenophilales bacterium CG_4_9_14_3_um_filter_59_35]